MTEDELAEQFQKHRKALVNLVAWRFNKMDLETVDMLYTDCWIALKDSTFKLGSLRSYLEKSLMNRVKNYLRNRAASQDIMDRGLWMEPSEGDTVPETGELWGEHHDSFNPLNFPDRRPYESQEEEETSIRVWAAMEQVPPTLAIVGQWYYVEQLTLAEIGKRLNCSHQNVSLMLMRFRSIFARQYHHLLNKES